jgi:DNA mismatch endonuclease (patch repair protein)
VSLRDVDPVPMTVSQRMAAVRQRNTAPELAFRRELRRLGIRFRIHARGLSGTPDVVLPDSRVAVFVHGCFWHRHRGCARASTPKSNAVFWSKKFVDNVRRDARNARELRSAGWIVCTVWECKLKANASIEAKRVATVRRSLAARSGRRVVLREAVATL